MNKTIRWGFALALLPLAACAGNPPPPAPAAPPAPPPLSAADQGFVTAAAQVDLAEISEAQLAQQMSKSPAILNYAQKVISDHQMLQQKLASIASDHGMTLPTTPSEAQQQEATTLQGLHGYRFNHTYIADQIAGHKMAVSEFQQEATSGEDPALKSFAEMGLPLIQQHLQMAQQIAMAHVAHHMRHHTAS